MCSVSSGGNSNGSVEVLNAGVSGYSTDQELLLWRSEGVRYAPDGVVLVYVSNDPVNNVRRFAYGHPKPLFLLQDEALVLSNVPVPESDWRLHIYSATSEA